MIKKIFFLVPLVLIGSVLSGTPEPFRQRVYSANTPSSPQETSYETETRFGRNLAARILNRYKSLEDKQVTRYVSLVGTAITAQFGIPELHYYFIVLDMPQVNAYACPGGYIFLTKGALAAMKNEAQLVGVLAHEIAHINRRHVIRKLNVPDNVEDLVGDVGQVIGSQTSTARVAMNQFLDEAITLLFEEGIGKQEELEADSDAVLMIGALNYDWKHYLEYIKQLKPIYDDSETKMSKTHPSIGDRLNRITVSSRKLGHSRIPPKTHAQRFNTYVQL